MQVVLDLLKYLAILLDIPLNSSAINWEDLKAYWKSEKKGLISQDDNKSIINMFYKIILLTERRFTEWYIFAKNITKTLLNTATNKIRENKIAPDTHWKDQLICIRAPIHSSSELSTKYNQDQVP